MSDPYPAATTSVRDTTKWLVASLPTAAVISAGIGVGPRLARASAVPTGIVLALIAVALGLLLVLGFGARVLAVHPASFKVLVEDWRNNRGGDAADGTGASKPTTSLIHEAEAEGVLYFHYPNFESMQAAVLEVWTDTTTDNKRALAAAAALRSYDVYVSTRRRFHQFLGAVAVGLALLVGGTWTAMVGLEEVPDSAIIDGPIGVTLTLTPQGAAALTESLGCGPDDVEDWMAIGGTWARPVLLADGTACGDEPWRPSDEHIDGFVLPQD